MSTDIIANRIVLKTTPTDIVASLNHESGTHFNEQDIDLRFHHCLDAWRDDCFMLLEQHYSSNVTPRSSYWSAFNIPDTRRELVCSYIIHALPSFEGGCTVHHGSRNTTPETALKRLRKAINEAIDLQNFLSAGIVNRMMEVHCRITTNEINIEPLLRMEATSVSTEGLYRFQITSPADVLRVKTLGYLARRYSGIDTPLVRVPADIRQPLTASTLI